MNRGQSQPPALASWLLWHLSPKKNREALAGDLFESFSQGHSAGWFWRQVLIAVSLTWPVSAVYSVGLVEILRAVIVLPMFAVLLLVTGSFGWLRMTRAFVLQPGVDGDWRSGRILVAFGASCR